MLPSYDQRDIILSYSVMWARKWPTTFICHSRVWHGLRTRLAWRDSSMLIHMNQKMTCHFRMFKIYSSVWHDSFECAAWHDSFILIHLTRRSPATLTCHSSVRHDFWHVWKDWKDSFICTVWHDSLTTLSCVQCDMTIFGLFHMYSVTWLIIDSFMCTVWHDKLLTLSYVQCDMTN